MNRFQKLMIIPALVIIAVSVLSGFSNPTAEKETQNLLKERTNLLQNAFYGQISHSEAEKRLAKIETYPLLTDDIHSIREWEASQLDIVRSMKIVSLELEKNLLNFITYRTEIYWDMSGLSGNYTMRGTYHVVVKKDNGGYKISVFDPIE